MIEFLEKTKGTYIIGSISSYPLCVENTCNIRSSQPRYFRLVYFNCGSNFNSDYKINHEKNKA